ncbi:hypothetical protein CRENBAI_024616 [Crenichthys baileyi]|uniref:Uncharacterized protein n=1 Tax=Crenichthys baileyi TaxID=28760 RepID=A0AAV9SGH3_9TELE
MCVAREWRDATVSDSPSHPSQSAQAGFGLAGSQTSQSSAATPHSYTHSQNAPWSLAARGPQLSLKCASTATALCVDVPRGQVLSSGLFRPQSAQTTASASRSSSSAPPSIMQPVVPSCSAVRLSSPLPSPPSLAYSIPVLGSVVHSLIQTLNQPRAPQRSALHSHRKDIKPPSVVLLC